MLILCRYQHVASLDPNAYFYEDIENDFVSKTILISESFPMSEPILILEPNPILEPISIPEPNPIPDPISISESIPISEPIPEPIQESIPDPQSDDSSTVRLQHSPTISRAFSVFCKSYGL